MDLLKKNSVLTGAVVLLALLNVGTLGTLWWQAAAGPGPSRPGAGSPGEFMENQLRFDNAQRKQFEALRETFQRESEPITSRLKAARLSLMETLQRGQSSDTTIVPLTDEIGRLQAGLELVTMHHFRSVRDLCDERQRQRFDRMMHDVLERIPGQPPPPPPGQPPGGMEGGPGVMPDDRPPGPPR